MFGQCTGVRFANPLAFQVRRGSCISALQCAAKCWLRGKYFLLSFFFSSIFPQQLPVSNFIKFFSSTIREVAHLLLTSSECLLLENTLASTSNPGDVFSPPEIAACKEECAQSAISKGSPFWTYNHINKKCHFRAVYDPKPSNSFWAGNTDSSCDYSNGCSSEST